MKLGSSPRMRGARTVLLYLLEEGRIIPAYAGSTGERGHAFQEQGDHPRVCGEHLLVGGLTAMTGGSSPRMRGAPRTLLTPQ